MQAEKEPVSEWAGTLRKDIVTCEYKHLVNVMK
jgi:hypothetical protein